MRGEPTTGSWREGPTFKPYQFLNLPFFLLDISRCGLAKRDGGRLSMLPGGIELRRWLIVGPTRQRGAERAGRFRCSITFGILNERTARESVREASQARFPPRSAPMIRSMTSTRAPVLPLRCSTPIARWRSSAGAALVGFGRWVLTRWSSNRSVRYELRSVSARDEINP